MFKQVTMIDVQDWNGLVQETYGRTYNFQQQDGCKDRGTEQLRIPVEFPFDYENTTVPEVANAYEMGVSFKAWLERSPDKKLVKESGYDFTDLWWKRNFYPSVDMIANDLHAKGLLPAGKFLINIDW